MGKEEEEAESSLPSSSSKKWYQHARETKGEGVEETGLPKEGEGQQEPCDPQVFTGECAPVRATGYLEMMGDLVSMGWERSGDHKRNSDPGTALSSCPDAGRNLDL